MLKYLVRTVMTGVLIVTLFVGFVFALRCNTTLDYIGEVFRSLRRQVKKGCADLPY